MVADAAYGLCPQELHGSLQKCGEAVAQVQEHVAVLEDGQAVADHILEKLLPILVLDQHLHYVQQDPQTASVHVAAKLAFLAILPIQVAQH